ERDDLAGRVAEELDLDVARPLDVALVEDAVVAERGRRLALRRRERLVELGRLADDPHPATAAARGRLDDEREADLLRLALRHDGNSGLAGDPLRRQLVAAGPQRLRGRPDPGQAGRLHGGGEVRALGEEAVAGVDRVRLRLAGRPQVLRGLEVARDLDGLVGRSGVQRTEVVRRDDGDGRDPELPAGAEDAQRDLATVRDE